jgi:hypothetical protein
MEPDREKTNKRLQPELPQRSYERLKSLKDKTEAASYSEVLKNALRLYESVIDQYEDGKRLFVKGEDGALIEYKVFL